jgi:2Fe-2S ferredoxin
LPKITYVWPGKNRNTVQVSVGLSVMQGAAFNGIDGIEAACGGNCACATCHVIVDPGWASLLPERSELEEAMLILVKGWTETSRLSCQITVTAALDGMIVYIPDSQH